MALYLDSTASKKQGEALGEIFGGKQGGNPDALVPFIGEVLGVRGLPIEYEARGNRHALSISKVAEMEVEDVVKLDGKKSAIHNAPFEPLVYVAKSKKFKYSEHGMNWNISEKNSFHSPFSWRGP